jgi:hypothetical protein
MGVDTKGLVATKNKDLNEISTILLDAIHKIPTNKDGIFGNNMQSSIDYIPRSSCFIIPFKDGKDERILWTFLNCDSDFAEVCDSGILLSFGCWGNSVELMKGFLRALSPLGDTYILENDCSGDWEKIEFDTESHFEIRDTGRKVRVFDDP